MTNSVSNPRTFSRAIFGAEYVLIEVKKTRDFFQVVRNAPKKTNEGRYFSGLEQNADVLGNEAEKC